MLGVPKELEIAIGLRWLALAQLVYETTDGRLGARGWLPGARSWVLDFLLLRTTGRSSGLTRTAELLYVRDGSNLVVAGSKGGSDHPPAWLLNLQAEPRAEVQVGRERRPVRARIATPRERPRLWRLLNARWDYDAYQTRTARKIPVVILEPAAEQS